MSRSQRDQAVRVFMMGNTAQVMLMSLKCGGVGLNLTRANRKPLRFLTSLYSDSSQASFHWILAGAKPSKARRSTESTVWVNRRMSSCTGWSLPILSRIVF
jgi:hypothetical protein